jgi:hypothetical protein
MRLLKWLDNVNYDHSWFRFFAWTAWMWMPFVAYVIVWLIYGSTAPGYVACPACLGSILLGFAAFWISFDRGAERLKTANPKAYDEWLSHPY